MIATRSPETEKRKKSNKFTARTHEVEPKLHTVDAGLPLGAAEYTCTPCVITEDVGVI
jgi:hypothetical protein